MPRRFYPQFTGEVYHIFNRGVGDEQIFTNSFEYQRMINLIDFYRFKNPRLRFSHYNRLDQTEKEIFLETLYSRGKKLVEIFAFCLMPNHFHFLLNQIEDQGISTFMGKIQNAYAKYFNTKKERLGSLFQLMYKGVRVGTDYQLKHVQRYIHLNPLTSFLVQKPEEIYGYQWSSFLDYVREPTHVFVDTKFILKMFYGNRKRLAKFTLDQVDYQRKLARIKHLTLG